MPQAQPDREVQETQETEIKKKRNENKDNASNVAFKLNAEAQEFVPRAPNQMPISGYYYPWFQYGGVNAGSDWIYVGDQEFIPLAANQNIPMPNCNEKDVLTEDVKQKIVEQVEYQFSDMSLLANLTKQMGKDPDGFVPIYVVASTKKIKSLNCSNHLLAQALLTSSKLVMSSDRKKVRRKHPFTEKDKENLQSRTIVAENLPDDYSHQSLEKLFGAVGSVKTIRICHPQDFNSSRSKGDFAISSKVDKLNDERNWRKGLRIRVLLRCTPKSVLKNRRSDFDGYLDNDDLHPELPAEFPQPYCSDLVVDINAEESLVGSKKGWARACGKLRFMQNHQWRGLLAPCPQPSSSILGESSSSLKQVTKGPRMPDGTRGFAMGRGKLLSTPLVALE